jgi:hypothetical protein
MRLKYNLSPWILLLSLLVTGCRRQAEPRTVYLPMPRLSVSSAESATPSAGTEGPSQSEALAVAALDDTTQEGVDATLATLNSMVADFPLSYNRTPKDLDELVTLKLLPKVPEAPPGKKYAIDPKAQQVVLVAR